MSTSKNFLVYFAFILPAFSSVAVLADDAKLSIQKVDPGAPLNNALSGSDNDCAIIVQDGKHYRVCPFKVSPDLQSAVRAAIDKM